MTKTTRDDDIAAGIRHDLFSAIKYEKRAGKNGDLTEGVQLGKHFVHRWIFQAAWDHFCISIPTASRCKMYTCEALFNGAEKWSGYAGGIRIAIGRCLMYFCDHAMLPVECANPHATGTKLYWVFDPKR
jgi:hypothetical protein